MNNEKRSNLAIWKIDRSYPSLDGLLVEDVISRVVLSWNSKEGVSGDQSLTLVPLTQNQIDNKNILIYHKKRVSSGLEGFLSGVINNNEERNIFLNINNDFLCFIFDTSDIFLITAGAGYHAIQNFIDENFPLEIAKKIFTGDFNHAEMRGLTGVTYSKTENYRRNYTFSRQESFGKIWKKLSGRIDQNVIRNSPSLSLVIDPNKKLTAEMKSSFTFRKSVSFEEVVTLINALQTLPDITDEKAEKFKFLDTLREIKDTTEKNLLKEVFLRRIFDELVIPTDSIDFDFCHPSKPLEFFTGCSYSVDNNMLSDSDYPTANTIISFIRQNNLAILTSFNDFKLEFEKLNFSFLQEETDTNSITADLLKCFHGEISTNGKSYFFIDGKWYETLGTFLDNLLSDFVAEVFHDDINNQFVTTEIPLLRWVQNGSGKYIEDTYNTLQSQEVNFYHGDKIFVITDKGKIELFDLLYVTDSKIYIIQVKNGFDTAMRNACSQIEIAAEIIEQDVKNGANILRKYYSEWSLHTQNTLNEQEFIDLFSRERVYILACSAGNPFTESTFNSRVLYSNIAQYETLGLKHLFKGKGYSLKIQNIEK